MKINWDSLRWAAIPEQQRSSRLKAAASQSNSVAVGLKPPPDSRREAAVQVGARLLHFSLRL